LESLLVFKDVIYNLEILNKLIFVDKNWPNDPKIGCKSPPNLVDFIETNANLEVEFEEGALEKVEVMEL